MRYASLALRTLSRLDLMSSRGIRSILEALWSLERKCSETVVGLELFVCKKKNEANRCFHVRNMFRAAILLSRTAQKSKIQTALFSKQSMLSC